MGKSIAIKFCNKCQCETDRNGFGQCKPCVRLRSAAWRLKNPEKKKAYQDQWLNNNPAFQQGYYEANKEKHLAYRARYKSENPEKVKLSEEKWRTNNTELARSRRSQCEKNNPEAKKLRLHNRRAKVLQVGGKLSKGIEKRLLVLQRGKCACCGLPLGENYHLDHIMPLALGGTNADENIQLLRQRCNNQKHAKHPIDFMQSRGFLL